MAHSTNPLTKGKSLFPEKIGCGTRHTPAMRMGKKK